MTPKALNGTYHLEVAFELHGLVNVAVGVMIVGEGDVRLRARRGQDHHRNAAEFRRGFYIYQYFAAGPARQVEIEKYEIGYGRLSETAAPRKIVERFDAVPDHVDVRGEAGVLECFHGQANVG